MPIMNEIIAISLAVSLLLFSCSGARGYVWDYSTEATTSHFDFGNQDFYQDQVPSFASDPEVDHLATAPEPGTLWPNGLVHYTVDPKFTQEARTNLQDAIKEYHSKTCVRFEPRSQQQAYLNISIDPSVDCGFAEVCKSARGGPQEVGLNPGCVSTFVMIHELGHSLCLEHEHQREDRDKHVEYGRSCQDVPKADYKLLSPKYFYDYRSQMHYECRDCGKGGRPKVNGVKKCGSLITPGLSILDVDYVNQLYNCQGCHRHRWRPIEKLTPADRAALPRFDGVSSTTPIYPCRGYVDGANMAVGTYSEKTGVCLLSFEGRVQSLRSGAEVLTIPGGLRKNGYRYQLTPLQDYEKMESNVHPIYAGFKADKIGDHMVAFSQRLSGGCSGFGRFNYRKLYAMQGFGTPAYFPAANGKERVDTDFYFLTCSSDAGATSEFRTAARDDPFSQSFQVAPTATPQVQCFALESGGNRRKISLEEAVQVYQQRSRGNENTPAGGFDLEQSNYQDPNFWNEDRNGEVTPTFSDQNSQQQSDLTFNVDQFGANSFHQSPPASDPFDLFQVSPNSHDGNNQGNGLEGSNFLDYDSTQFEQPSSNQGRHQGEPYYYNYG